MRRTAKLALALVAIVAVGAGAYRPAWDYWVQRHRPKWQFAEVKRGDLVSVVNATGTVKPELSVRVGALVSGPVSDLFADFNDEVTENQVLAKIDERVFRAAYNRDAATLDIRKADQKRAEAQLKQTEKDLARAKALQQKNSEYISQAELDQLQFKLESLQAELAVAVASVRQAEANLETSKTNLEFTNVVSPVAGIVIDRKIDRGQALASSFQTPEMFVVAPNFRQKIHVYASVDETEIGLIQQAKERGQRVQFTVDAHPDQLFEGVIEEIRLSSTELQNVVTYPVIVAAPNADFKLLPGMTANLSFRVDERKDVVKVPNAALRFYPDEKQVRPEDRKLLEGIEWKQDNDNEADVVLSAEEKAEARRQRNRRHVWAVEGGYLRAIPVVVGLSDSKYSELVSGELKVGQQLVTGVGP